MIHHPDPREPRQTGDWSLTSREAKKWTVLAALVGVIFTVAVSVVTARAQIDGKADRSAVEKMAEDVAAIKVLVCRQYPNDTLCRAER